MSISAGILPRRVNLVPRAFPLVDWNLPVKEPCRRGGLCVSCQCAHFRGRGVSLESKHFGTSARVNRFEMPSFLEASCKF